MWGSYTNALLSENKDFRKVDYVETKQQQNIICSHFMFTVFQ